MMLGTRVIAPTVVGIFLLGLVGPAAAAGAVAYPTPGQLPAVTAGTLDDRYTATQRAVRDALTVARGASDDRRAEALESLRGRNLLEFDPRGNGRAVEVIGDLAGADRVAVVVPGSHMTLDTFDYRRGPGGSARALAEAVSDARPRTRVATLAWLGYETPQGISPRSLTDGLARAGADALRTTVASIRAVNPEAAVSLLCHSYGSVVCAYAAADLSVSDLALYGSPGVGAATAEELATGARVWAGRAAEDWIRFVPPVRVAGLGFGADPVGRGFGARVFAAGDGSHGDYYLPGSEALRNLARIVLGRPSEVRDG